MAKKPNNKSIKLFLFSLLIIILLLIIFRTDSVEIEGKNYIGDKEECSRIQFLCVEGKEKFDDEKGCGCQDIIVNSFEKCVSAGNPVMESYPRRCMHEGTTFVEEIEEKRQFCMPDERGKGACIALYQPVCGFSDPEKIQCIRAPCANTYSNSCFACGDENVLYWTEGVCE